MVEAEESAEAVWSKYSNGLYLLLSVVFRFEERHGWGAKPRA